MLHEMFHLPLPLVEKVARAALIYGFLVVALRLAGKRELAQLSTIDFVVLLAVANAVQNGIIGNDDSVTGGVIGAATLFVLNAALVRILIRSAGARRAILGKPTVLVHGGKPLDRALIKEGITREQLDVAVQRQNTDDVSQVEEAILEPGGAIVVKSRGKSRELVAIEELTHRVDELARRVGSLAGDGR